MTTEIEDGTPSERAQHLLRVLVERYIRDGQPVGSRTLSKESGLELSSATIRNVMADLEEIGFLDSPHTSAGRVPTPKGFRFFVDTLLRVQPVGQSELRELRKQIDSEAANSQSLATTTSNLLSSLTRLAGLVTLPKTSHCTLRHLEFLPLSERRILAIMVVNSHEVQNRVLHVDRDYEAAELVKASNYLNEQFAGLEIDEVRRRLLEELRQTREDMNRLMLDAIAMAQRALEVGQDEELEYVLAGETNLMGFQELSDIDKLRQLFQMFNEKRDLLRLLDRTVTAEGVQIFIGDESGYNVLGECSVVAAPYTRDNEVVGVLGVIGPTRMPYDRVIPVVDITSRLLSSALKSRAQTP
jgi:heat-inducible transcriptional repressor